MTTHTLRQAAQAMLVALDDGQDGYTYTTAASHRAAVALRAALAEPEPVDSVPVVATINGGVSAFFTQRTDYGKNLSGPFKVVAERDHLAAIAAKDAEIADQRERVEFHQATARDYFESIQELQRGLAQRDAEIAALKADAARYRWLRTNQPYTIKACGDSIHCGGHHLKRPEEFGPALDAAIDKESKT